MLLILFWTAVAFIAYTYAGFPLLVFLRALVCRRRYVSADITPALSMIIVAHNEAKSIRAKLDNCAALDYPQDLVEVIVASDGSNDGTNEIVASYEGRPVKLLALPRQGKIPALNAAAAAASGEVLVFSDATTMFASDALRALVRPLADPAVGGVAGDQRYFKQKDAANAGEHAYWSFDRMLKRAESAAGNTISGTGAIYAIRRALFRPAPSGVTDDFATSTGVIAQGYRLVFADDAIGYEEAAHTSGVEFGRKTRVINRGLRGVLARRELLNPLRHGFYSLQLFSHKVLRRLVFLPLLVLLAVNPFLWSEGMIYQATGILQAAVYGCALIGASASGTRVGRAKPFAIPFYFCLVNVACLVACVQLLRGRRIELWDPQRREGATLDTAMATVSQRRLA